jgi:hypothetical protein
MALERRAVITQSRRLPFPVPLDEPEPLRNGVRERTARPDHSGQRSAHERAALKLVVNQVYENAGLGVTQTLGPILDGLMRTRPMARVHR